MYFFLFFCFGSTSETKNETRNGNELSHVDVESTAVPSSSSFVVLVWVALSRKPLALKGLMDDVYGMCM